MLFALWLGVVITGCAALGSRLDGSSGPIAWQATDLRVVGREVAGADRDLYAFVLVLRETQGTAITFTRMAYTISQPGVNDAGVSEQQAILWKLRPHGELRQPFSSYWYCAELDCERVSWGATAPWWHIVLTGTDARSHPVRVVIDLKLPQNPPGPSMAQPKEPSGTPPPATTPTVEGRAIPIQVVNNTLLVNAVLNSQEYVTLLLDTGSAHTILTPATAKRLRISPPADAPKHTGIATGGQEVEFAFTQLAALAMGDTVLENQRVGIALVLPEAPLVDGILGEDFLRHFIVTLHYARSRLQLESSVPLPPGQLPTTAASTVKRYTAPLHIASGRIWVRARLNHQEDVTFLLDTGATHTLVHPDTAKRVGISTSANAPRGTITVFGGRQIAFPLTQATVTVGDATVADLQVGVLLALPWAPQVAGILGGDFLHHFTVTLDHASSRLWLESDAVAGR